MSGGDRGVAWAFPRELFEEKGLRQVTVWTRGVVLIKEARDVVTALAGAAAREGKQSQAWENYVDLPDRINVPVKAYARISDRPIESRYIYENEAPDIVVVVEESLVKGNPILDGLRPGGTLVVNTRRRPEEIARFLTPGSGLGLLAVVDAAGIATTEKTLSGQEGASDASGIGGGWAAPLSGAVVRACGLVGLPSLEAVVKAPEAARIGYERTILLELA
ncbi:MAG: 2-oxoacid:acceptor oxidoreductase family protein [Firmicutes bacterium]|nr:2-oxoacid:acceptor oxidoreductase family protein [Bacillota bacterium]